MHRIALAGLMVSLLLLLGASQVSTFEDVVAGLETDGYFVEPGAEEVDTRELATIVSDSDVGLRPVILADAPVGGEEQLANDILDDLGSGTVMVVSPSDIAVSTDRVEDAEVEAALDRAEEQADSLEDLPGYLRTFDQALAGTAGEGTSRGRLAAILLVGALIVGGMALYYQVRNRRAAAAQQERALREAREEVGSQISTVADRIVALHDQVELAGTQDVSRLYASATEIYSQAQNRLERSTSADELERVADELDRARWQLESVTALIDGREPPPEPAQQAACFFDPTHGAGTQEATIDTAGRRVDVRVCGSCADKLRAGDAPQPRMIAVDGQPVPAAKAPRSHGGGGFDHLDDFVVVLGDRRYPYTWGGYHGWGFPRRRRSWFSGWGWGGGFSTGDRDGRRTSRRGGWSGNPWGSPSRSRSIRRGSASRSRGSARRRR